MIRTTDHFNLILNLILKLNFNKSEIGNGRLFSILKLASFSQTTHYQIQINDRLRQHAC